MSKKPMTWDRIKIRNHCAEGRCMHPFYSSPICITCRLFREIVRSGKYPGSCVYYNHRPDIENFNRRKSK